MKDYIKIARIDHWIKNMFIVPGIAVAILLLDESQRSVNILHIIIGFLQSALLPLPTTSLMNGWMRSLTNSIPQKNSDLLSAEM